MAKAALGFAFGGGGWLTTWYLGVLQGLIASGAFKPGVTPIYGVSTGAQAAALGCAGGDPFAAVAGALLDAQHCLDTGTTPPCLHTLDAVMRARLNASLPAGAAKACSGLLTLGFTKPLGDARLGRYGQPRMMWKGNFRESNFTSDADLIDAVAASGYLPCTSANAPYAVFRGRPAMAGGYTLRTPCPRNAKRCVTVHSGVPGKLFSSGFPNVSVAADSAASSLPSSGSGSGGGALGRRLAAVPAPLPSSCPIEVGAPEIVFGRRPGIDIYPGKYNPVAYTWWTWESWVVAKPSVEGLRYGFELGIADATSWARAAKIIK